jgi:hypothetical protein
VAPLQGHLEQRAAARGLIQRPLLVWAAGLRRPQASVRPAGYFRDVATTGNGSWSLYGAERSQPAATGRKSDGGKNGPNRRKPLPWVATGCLRCSMVRRVDGSSPSEGSAKAPQTGAFCFGCTCRVASVRWVWSPFVERSGSQRAIETAKIDRIQPKRTAIAPSSLTNRRREVISRSTRSSAARRRSRAARWPSVGL